MGSRWKRFFLTEHVFLLSPLSIKEWLKIMANSYMAWEPCLFLGKHLSLHFCNSYLNPGPVLKKSSCLPWVLEQLASLTIPLFPHPCDAENIYWQNVSILRDAMWMGWKRALPFVPTIVLSSLAFLTCSSWKESDLIALLWQNIWLNKALESSFLAWLPNPSSPFCGLSFIIL